jgi:serine/threonine-protein kinase
MSERIAFIVPVVIDQTPDAGADVPEAFRSVQWTRLPAGETPPEFVKRIQQLLSGKASFSATVARGAPVASRKSSLLKAACVAVALAAIAAYVIVERPWVAKSAAFAPPPHSIAVLPFVNMSGDKEQEYFSDGLTEELLNSLTEINDLQVAARTSAFSFKGKDVKIGTIARELNVGTILEGSVRRSGNTVRITTQLIDAVSGFHLWSHTYDRDLGDVLTLETEIAAAVASALKVSLLGDLATKIELGGTGNPAAFDAYLRARKAYLTAHGPEDYKTAAADFTEAIALDPSYALALANRSIAFNSYADAASGPAVREAFDEAHADALKATALTPDLGDAHLALAFYLQKGALDFTRANEEFERALALAPNSARVLQGAGSFAVSAGRTERGIAEARRAVVLDPLNRDAHSNLGEAFYYGRQNKEALAAFQDALALDPEDSESLAYRGLAYYALGDFESARASCETKPDYWASQWCLAVVYNKLGRHADAESVVAKMKATDGDAVAFQFAGIYAQWGNAPKALDWLEKALQLPDPGLISLKTDALLDPLRKEPRFQVIEQALKFPN